eukprot:scaffold276617_cov14-Tisochrysis_lutea.AAC.1
MPAALQVLAEREQLSAQGLAMVLWALARLRLQPGRLWLHTLLAPHSPLSKRKAGQEAGPGQGMTRDCKKAHSPISWPIGPGGDWAGGAEPDVARDDGGREAAGGAE